MSFLQMSLAGAIMILVITVLRALAMNRVPKRTFPVLWGCVLVRLLVPFSLPFGLSIYSILARKTAPVTVDAPAAVMPVVPAGQAAAAAQQAAVTAGTAASVWSIVWLAGMLLCAAFFAAAYWSCSREFQMSFPVEHDAAARWLRAHPLRRRLSIRQSDRVASPLTFGILHPVILMPKKTDWDDETALSYVLEHEFVHIRRFDMLFKLLLIAAACAHWFNPLVWVLYVLANRDLELSCDEAVVRHFGTGTRASYANVLIRMEETKSGFAPLGSHFSANAIEERITAIMKLRKTTILSLVLAVILIAGTVTVFATSAKTETVPAPAAGSTEAVESGEPLQPSAEYAAAGISAKKNSWYYQGKAIASIYDDNGDIYMNESDANGSYLHVVRDTKGAISQIDVLTKAQFKEVVDRQMNANPPATTVDEGSLMSYVDPSDGKTYYSFDGGQTFEPLTDEEFEARFPTPDIEWWTYDEYKAWLETEKKQLQDCIGDRGWANGEEFVWTQEKVDETVAMYESILEEIKNGVLYSRSIEGEEEMAMRYDPTDCELGTWLVTTEADTAAAETAAG